jgi:hypothetical protein
MKRKQMINFNPLLSSLVIVTQLFKRPFSAESLISGLPIEEGKSTPELLLLIKRSRNFQEPQQKQGFFLS